MKKIQRKKLVTLGKAVCANNVTGNITASESPIQTDKTSLSETNPTKLQSNAPGMGNKTLSPQPHMPLTASSDDHNNQQSFAENIMPIQISQRHANAIQVQEADSVILTSPKNTPIIETDGNDTKREPMNAKNYAVDNNGGNSDIDMILGKLKAGSKVLPSRVGGEKEEAYGTSSKMDSSNASSQSSSSTSSKNNRKNISSASQSNVKPMINLKTAPFRNLHISSDQSFKIHVDKNDVIYGNEIFIPMIPFFAKDNKLLMSLFCLLPKHLNKHINQVIFALITAVVCFQCLGIVFNGITRFLSDMSSVITLLLFALNYMFIVNSDYFARITETFYNDGEIENNIYTEEILLNREEALSSGHLERSSFVSLNFKHYVSKFFAFKHNDKVVSSFGIIPVMILLNIIFGWRYAIQVNVCITFLHVTFAMIYSMINNRFKSFAHVFKCILLVDVSVIGNFIIIMCYFMLNILSSFTSANERTGIFITTANNDTGRNNDIIYDNFVICLLIWKMLSLIIQSKIDVIRFEINALKRFVQDLTYFRNVVQKISYSSQLAMMRNRIEIILNVPFISQYEKTKHLIKHLLYIDDEELRNDEILKILFNAYNNHETIKSPNFDGDTDIHFDYYNHPIVHLAKTRIKQAYNNDESLDVPSSCNNDHKPLSSLKDEIDVEEICNILSQMIRSKGGHIWFDGHKESLISSFGEQQRTSVVDNNTSFSSSNNSKTTKNTKKTGKNQNNISSSISMREMSLLEVEDVIFEVSNRINCITKFIYYIGIDCIIDTSYKGLPFYSGSFVQLVNNMFMDGNSAAFSDSIFMNERSHVVASSDVSDKLSTLEFPSSVSLVNPSYFDQLSSADMVLNLLKDKSFIEVIKQMKDLLITHLMPKTPYDESLKIISLAQTLSRDVKFQNLLGKRDDNIFNRTIYDYDPEMLLQVLSGSV